ncbi:MAG: hypothetical protein U0325_12515 [Polyangiales bacterium]
MSTPSRAFRLILASVATFGVGVLLGLQAEAQPRWQGHHGVRGAVVVPSPWEGPVPASLRFRRPRARMHPMPVYVQPAPVYVQPAPVVAQDRHGILITAETRLFAGQAVRAQWGAGWFDAQIIAVEPGGVRIHYTGYSDGWNEVVPLHRLRIAA